MPETGIRFIGNARLRRIAALGLVVVGATAWWWSRRPAVRAARPSVAVLKVENRSQLPDAAWLAAALSETLSSTLAIGGELRLIPGETVARMRQELSLTEARDLPRATLGQIGRSLNTDFVVVGSYQVTMAAGGRQLRLELHLQDTQRGAHLTSASATGNEEQLFRLVTRVGASLREALGARGISSADDRSIRSTMPASLKAFRLYLDGLEKLRTFDALAARDSLEKAVAHDPDYAPAHALLSQAFSTLGYDRQAEASARRAYELAQGLPQEDYLRIEARYYEEASEWQKAIDTHREVWRRFPDSIEYGLQLAEAQVAAGRGREALETVEALHRLAGSAGQDPRIDLVEAAAAVSLSDLEAQLTAASTAARKGKELGASILVADALRLQGEALYRLLEPEAAYAAFVEAQRLFAEAGDRAKAAQVLTRIAEVLYYERDNARAEELYHAALAIDQEIGHRREVGRVQNSLGVLLYSRGELETARNMLEEAVAIGRELGDRHSEADYLDSLVQVLILQGDLLAARELAQEELALYQRIGNREWTAWSHFNLGRITLASGEVMRARDQQERALVMGDELANSYLTGSVLDALAQVLMAAGDLSGARRMSEDSRAIRRELELKSSLAESWITASRIALEIGSLADAEALAREAADVFRRQGMPDEETAATAQLARSLLAQGRVSDSRAALAGAGSHAAGSQNPTVRLSMAMSHARLLAAEGREAEARRELEEVAAEAAASGLVLLELEARLARGELEHAAPEPAIAAAGRTRLEALATRARDLGCGLIAARAAEAGAPARAGGAWTPPGSRAGEAW